MNMFKFKLTPSDTLVLHMLKVEPCSVSQLTWLCNNSRRTVQRSIARLLERGLIEIAYTMARNEKVYQLAGEENDVY
jgi:predicted transcriptional regulator